MKVSGIDEDYVGGFAEGCAEDYVEDYVGGYLDDPELNVYSPNL